MDRSADRVRVVAHTADGALVKGYLNGAAGVADVHTIAAEFRALPPRLGIETLDGKALDVDTSTLKALFFVKSFEGRREYSEVKFFEANPTNEGLWVRLRFADGECTEGIVHNSLYYVNEEGFFLKPPDPQSNNQLVYVLKNSLRDFRVLGVRSRF